MATKWRPGSAGEKEAKENKIIAAFLIIVSLLILGVEFVFPSMVRDEVKAAPLVFNIIGGLLTAGSVVPPIIGLTSMDDTKNYARWWVILLALGILTSAGFYGYTY